MRSATIAFRNYVDGLAILGNLAEGVDEPDLELDFVEAARIYLGVNANDREDAKMNLEGLRSLEFAMDELFGRYPDLPRAIRERHLVSIALHQALRKTGERDNLSEMVDRALSASQKLLVNDPTSAQNALFAADIMKASFDDGERTFSLGEIVAAYDSLARRNLLPPTRLPDLALLKMQLAGEELN